MVRGPHKDDVARLAEIHVYGWRYAYRGLVPDEELFGERLVTKAIPFHTEIIEKYPERLHVWDDGLVKGFILHSPSRDGDKPDAYEVGAFYVEPAFVRGGIGHSLMEAAVAYAKSLGKREMILWSLEKNEIGLGFYHRFGYRPDGARKSVPEWNLDEIRLSLSLAG